MTARQLADALTTALERGGLPDARRLTRHYFSDAELDSWQVDPGAVYPASALARVERDARRLVAGEPLQYVTGVAHFYGLRLHVGPGVLIPRPETEELVRWVLETEEAGPLAFADLCTGSGCIAAALASRRPRWRGLAIDLDEGAIAVARQNLAAAELGDRVRVEGGDVLSPNLALGAEKPWDLLVSNPPYIPDADWDRVAASVDAFEPHLALRVPTGRPLLFYERLVAQARTSLRPGGRVYVECNDRYVADVEALFRMSGLLEVEHLVDMQGRPRHVRGRLPG